MAASVQISCPSRHGTGAYIGAGLVVTAAHVVHPRNHAKFAANRVRVVLPNGNALVAKAVWCHHRWDLDFRATSDMALIRVAPTASLVFSRRMDVDAAALAVDVLGYREGPRTGHVTRVDDPDGNSFKSNDLAYHEGVSGAPIVDGNGNAIGIATRSPDIPTPASFVGLPFISDNLGWLLNNAP